MRLYTREMIEFKSPHELLGMLDSVKTNSLTHNEKTANIKILEDAIHGHTRRDDILADIAAGKADTDDAEGSPRL